MSTGEIQARDVQDGGIIPSEGAADCPEPCSCEESNALRELLECIVEYDAATNPCDPDFCGGDCAFCTARVLLAKLEEKRNLRR
jgi:hypothetical protein